MRLYELYLCDDLHMFSLKRMYDAIDNDESPIRHFKYIGNDCDIFKKLYSVGDYNSYFIHEFGFTDIKTRKTCVVVDMYFFLKDERTFSGVKFTMVNKFLSSELREQSINILLR